MQKVITFGSGTRDVFLAMAKGEKFMPGAKVAIDDLEGHTGGGGTNVACGLRNLGIKAFYMGKVGDDEMGKAVEKDLLRFRVGLGYLIIDGKRKTAMSVIVSPYKGDRTALVYRGACHFLEETEVPWKRMRKANWFYIAPLREASLKLFPKLIKFAKENGIKVMVNPSREQIKHFDLAKFKDVDVLMVNGDELKAMGGIEKVCKSCKGIVVVTNGNKGSVVYKDDKIYKQGIKDKKAPKEKTGAGDAYGSGFLAGLLKKNNIEYAMQLGTANAEACITKVGAKNGLLKKS